MSYDPFTAEISRHVWDTKYRYREDEIVRDSTVEDSWLRIARAVAHAETQGRAHWERRFLEILSGFRFLPGGRIQAGAGTQRRVTLFNCFVMGLIDDSMDGIFEALKEGALTMQQGGGVGYDFSTLRPRGTRARSCGSIASGPVSFMRIWDSVCATILSTGARRGAMMATLRCDHPDIEEYVDSKRDPHSLRHFNLSVQVSDAFMEAAEADLDWPLVFPASRLEPTNAETVERHWPGFEQPVPCTVVGRVRARELWQAIMRANYEYAEPGVLFVDRINRWNNLWYREYITATNPCGEIPLPAYGACNLGSINLTSLVHDPFSNRARFDFDKLAEVTRVGVRLLDNVVDVSEFPLQAQAAQAQGSRRIGLGLTGLADTLIMLGLRYDTEQGRSLASSVMQCICHSAYRASIELAREKGTFPFFEASSYLQGRFVQTLPQDIREGIRTHGIRNSHLTAIAPTGTISLLANNVSSGIEPVFDFVHTRRMLRSDGSYHQFKVQDYAWALWQQHHERGGALPPFFIDARSASPETHLSMQAALQPFVDSAISKTINVPADYDLASFHNLYRRAYEYALKGCTTFRPNPVTGAVLESAGVETGVHCCTPERECD